MTRAKVIRVAGQVQRFVPPCSLLAISTNVPLTRTVIGLRV